MKAWVYRKEQDSHGIHIFQEDIPIPTPAADQVLLRVEKVSVCGTDESLFRGDLKKVPDGIVPGHEFYGEVVEVGREVRGVSTGERVAGESHYHAPGATDQGIIGLWGAEIRKGELLEPLNGAYAEYLCIPADCAHLVPGDLVSEGFWPSLFEAVGNDYFLIKKMKQDETTHHLGLFGCGPHGLFAQVFARYFGIPKIAAFETDPLRRKFASDLQIADRVLDPLTDLNGKVNEFTNGQGFDVTIDLVGKQGHAFTSCCDTTKDGGTIYLFGLFTDRFSIGGVSGNDIIFKMRTLELSYNGKKLRVVGVTGREGIWPELISTVCQHKNLQDQLMKPIQVMGTLDRLGDDTRNPKPGMLKRAYYPFAK